MKKRSERNLVLNNKIAISLEKTIKMKKIIPKISFYIFVLLHLFFLLPIFLEKLSNPLVVIFILLISFSLIIAYANIQIDKDDNYIENYFSTLVVILGAIITYYLNIKLELGPVIAAGAVGTIASFVPLINKQSNILKVFPFAAYCGAFVGMSAVNVAKDIKFIILASFLAGLFFIFSKNVLNGFGGKLGTIAFGGVVLASLLISIWIHLF